jgi:hypothetical protein
MRSGDCIIWYIYYLFGVHKFCGITKLRISSKYFLLEILVQEEVLFWPFFYLVLQVNVGVMPYQARMAYLRATRMVNMF